MGKTEIKIFVSSTFKDLDEERRALVGGVFPRVKAYAGEKGLSLYFVDLRWGITANETDEIIRECLSEIDRCAPFFIGIVGNRYGYVPDSISALGLSDESAYSGRSITEMEMIYGVFKRELAPRTLFAVKRTASADELRLSNLADSEADVEKRVERLLSLKRRVLDYCRETSTPCLSDYDDISALCDFFYSELCALVDREASDIGDVSAFKQENYLAESLRGVRKNNHMFERLHSAISSGKNRLFVMSEDYIGKTTLLNHYFSQFPSSVILNIAADRELSEPDGLYLHLGKRLGLERCDRESVNSFLSSYSGRRLYVVINDVNLLKDGACELLPAQVSDDVVLALSTNEPKDDMTLSSMGYERIIYRELDAFIYAEEFIVDECQRYGKDLSDEMRRLLRTTEICRSFAAAKIIIDYYVHSSTMTFIPALRQCRSLEDFLFILAELCASREKFLSYTILMLLDAASVPIDLDVLYEILEAVPSKEKLYITLNRFTFTRALSEISTLLSYAEGRVGLLNKQVKRAVKRSVSAHVPKLYEALASIVSAVLYTHGYPVGCDPFAPDSARPQGSESAYSGNESGRGGYSASGLLNPNLKHAAREEKPSEDEFVDPKMRMLFGALLPLLGKLSEHFEVSTESLEPLEIILTRRKESTSASALMRSYIINDKTVMMAEMRMSVPPSLLTGPGRELLEGYLVKGDGFNSVIEDGELAVGYSIKFTPDPQRLAILAPNFILSLANVAGFFLIFFDLVGDRESLSESEFSALYLDAYDRIRAFVKELGKGDLR